MSRLRLALQSVLAAWINGRKVADGIPMTVRVQAESALTINIWTTNRPIVPGWYWVKIMGMTTMLEIREYDLLFGGRPELKNVTAWQGPIEPQP